MFLKKSYIPLILAVVCVSSSFAGWSNSGTMNLEDSQMSLPSFENNGQLILKGENMLSFEEFSGNGLIKIESGVTKIKATEFLFNGTIECNGTLEIITSTPKAQINIKRQGKGTITIKSA